MAVQSTDLAASAARTTDGEGSAFDAGRPGLSGSALLEVTASSGTGPTLVVTVETSETGLDEWESVAEFPSASGSTKLRVLLKGLKRYVRAAWTIGGTTPSFTFKVSAKLYDHLITVEQLESHMSPTTVGRIFDDSGQGASDEDAVNSVLGYASSMLRGKIGPVTTLDGFTPETQSEVNRIGLDICEARAAIRHPEVVRKDGMKLMEMARKDLRDIRLGQSNLGTTEAPQPDTLDAGVVVSGPPRDTYW